MLSPVIGMRKIHQSDVAVLVDPAVVTEQSLVSLNRLKLKVGLGAPAIPVHSALANDINGTAWDSTPKEANIGDPQKIYRSAE